MNRPGSISQPLRVAVVGSGPAGFYTIQHLFRQQELNVQADLFERLEAPFGLVRYGVAPDHPKIKSVIAVYEKLARDPRFRFFGNVGFGDQLRQHRGGLNPRKNWIWNRGFEHEQRTYRTDHRRRY